MKHLLNHECDLIYECKVCKSLFRSLLNFISHKRIYCCDMYSIVHTQTNEVSLRRDKDYATELELFVSKYMSVTLDHVGSRPMNKHEISRIVAFNVPNESIMIHRHLTLSILLIVCLSERADAIFVLELERIYCASVTVTS